MLRRQLAWRLALAVAALGEAWHDRAGGGSRPPVAEPIRDRDRAAPDLAGLPALLPRDPAPAGVPADHDRPALDLAAAVRGVVQGRHADPGVRVGVLPGLPDAGRGRDAGGVERRLDRHG